MDNKKIIKLDIKQQEIVKESGKKPSESLHTNPIVQKMIKVNLESKKDKFSLKDLY